MWRVKEVTVLDCSVLIVTGGLILRSLLGVWGVPLSVHYSPFRVDVFPFKVDTSTTPISRRGPDHSHICPTTDLLEAGGGR